MLNYTSHPLSRLVTAHFVAVTPTEYALHWLTGHPGYPMQGEELKTIQVPSVCLVSLHSPVSSSRCCHLSSGGYTTNQPTSPEDIPFSPEQKGQAASLSNSQSQVSMPRCGPILPLSTLLPFTPVLSSHVTH